MSAATLTPEAKRLLSATIRDLRERLLRDLKDEAERRYRLSVPAAQAGLDEAHRRRRQRLESWIEERVRAARPENQKAEKEAQARLLQQAIKEAAATLLNRLVLLRHLEALRLSSPAVVTGGWNSAGYQELRGFAPDLCGDETEGYATVLQLVFDELAVDLPGLYGDVGLTRLFPVPPATLRELVARLDDKELASAWTDDTTLGWVYQYWNDPERETLDAKIAGGGKIEPHEIASKTQMFTERYMVEWLLQNSLGLTWLCICKKNGWTPDAEQVLPRLEERRAAWRQRRDAGEVALDALMPIEGQLEEDWKYFVPQPIQPDAVEKAPTSIRALKLLDPACGSGHFLTSAFDLLAGMYREEARHRRVSWSDEEIAASIVADNLHGVDIDPRAVQIAAAGLYLKARRLATGVRLLKMNLVAPALQLGGLPPDDPALADLRRELEREVGIPQALTMKLIGALAGVDHLGTLLKVDKAVEEALGAAEFEFERAHGQGSLFEGFPQQQVKLTLDEARATVLGKLEQFLARHSAAGDLGLRLDGEQLAAGVRFVRIVREGAYDVVVGNPPYQGVSKTALSDYVAAKYPRGKADLYAAFLERGLELCRARGTSGLVTMQGWMYLQQFADLRRWILEDNSLSTLADLMWCAFENMRHATVAMAVVSRGKRSGTISVALAPTDRSEREESIPALRKKRAALVAHVGRSEFDTKGFEAIEGEPIVYWWSDEFLKRYAAAPKLGSFSRARVGMKTSDNARYVRLPHELSTSGLDIVPVNVHELPSGRWIPYVQGAAGRAWFEPVTEMVLWSSRGLQIRLSLERAYGMGPQGERNFFRPGVSFSTIGASFTARAHRFKSAFSTAATSLFDADVALVTCILNSATARRTVESLNPTINFMNRDVERVAVLSPDVSMGVMDVLEPEFAEHESAREPSVEFKGPAPSPWRHAQIWAQLAVDRPEGVPLAPYTPEYDPPEPTAFVSFAVGVTLGRFGAKGEGILDVALPTALPGGILFLSAAGADSLNHPACAPLHEAWKEHGDTVGGGDDLRTYLAESFFSWHRKLYENRPIYFPLSSAKRSFVAFVSIHRWQGDTLQMLRAEQLVPALRRLEGELSDLQKARKEGVTKNKAERRFAEVQKLIEELTAFIDKVSQVAEFGPPPPESPPQREADARFVMDLDDGVMVNSAALWPLLEPQWKDPKKWWKELATAQGRKNYDWSHLAGRYFPKRVRGRCVDDPSLAVAHKCFWELHPAKAYAWELRLQDEISPEFTIDEPGSDEARARFLEQKPDQARTILADEQKRRARKAAKAGKDDDAGDEPLLERAQGEEDEADA